MRTLLAIALCTVAVAVPAPVRPAFPDKVTPNLRDALTTAAPGATVRAWVYFADKGDVTRGRADAERSLTDRARTRRERNRVAVDGRDIAVAAEYVHALENDGVRVRHVSRWLNAVSVEVRATDVVRVEKLAFVTRIDRVRSHREPLFDASQRAETAQPVAPQRRAAYTLDYGESLPQNEIINVPALHDQGFSGSGVMVAMLDAGFNNLAHEALVDIDVFATWDFVNGDANVADQIGQAGTGNHGTYTLSAMAGFEPGDLIGPAYGATFVLAKTENTDWERHVEEDDWIAGAEWADSLGVDIISSSLSYAGGFTNGEPSYTWEDMDGNTTIVALGADIAASRGIVVVNSAGNGGWVSLPANTLGSPADGDSVLAVGSVDAAGVRAGSSSVGPSADGQIKPDVMARGVGVVAASPILPDVYASVGGTSLSCPQVAGVAALLLEARPSASNVDIMNALRQTADRAGAPDREYGYGIVDAVAAANYVLSGVGGTPRAGAVLHPAYPNPFNPSTTIRFDLASHARVTLAIYDVRGARVATLIDEERAPGRYSATWNARDRNGNALASGVYLCRLVSAGEQRTRKLVLLK